MISKKAVTVLVAICCTALLFAGCSTTRHRHDPAQLRTTTRPALSLAMQQPDFVVAVSPVRQTMQVAGTIPRAIGTGISAVQDGQHTDAVRAALGDYDARSVFLARMEQRLADQFTHDIARVAPQGTLAGYANAREAREVRLDGLRRAGYDVILELDLRFGIYGPEGILVVNAAGELTDVPTGRVQWRNEVAWHSTDLFADVRWSDPTRRLRSNIFSPRLTIADDAVGQWTRDNAAPLRDAFEQAVDHVVAAVLADLGLEKTVEGLYTLGHYHVLNGNYQEAAEAFTGAIEIAPDMHKAVSGLAVALGKNGQVEDAIALAEKLAAAKPDYMPNRYNLAWWYAVEMEDIEQARPHYDKARALGAQPGRRLRRAMSADN